MANCASATYNVPQVEGLGPEYSTKPVDLVHISRQTFGCRDLVNEVLGMFVSHSEQCLKRMSQADTDEAWADAAHSIKGSGRTIGAWAVANLAEIYERMARNGELQDREIAYKEIEEGVMATNQYIQILTKRS